ncbi:RHS domain-containing protein [Escherichia coli]|uniref:RHS domain-containing protein n=1 Tax=Escherichia coli TaxID=562 RepID=UPI00216A8544|nr:RHS domain-containing protein [Escherichia coli]
MDPVYTPARKIHLYHCDHRGLPLALISTEGATAWCAREKSTCTTATIAACRWRSSARKGQQRGAQNMMNGATC